MGTQSLRSTATRADDSQAHPATLTHSDRRGHAPPIGSDASAESSCATGILDDVRWQSLFCSATALARAALGSPGVRGGRNVLKGKQGSSLCAGNADALLEPSERVKSRHRGSVCQSLSIHRRDWKAAGQGCSTGLASKQVVHNFGGRVAGVIEVESSILRTRRAMLMLRSQWAWLSLPRGAGADTARGTTHGQGRGLHRVQN